MSDILNYNMNFFVESSSLFGLCHYEVKVICGSELKLNFCMFNFMNFFRYFAFVSFQDKTQVAFLNCLVTSSC